MDTCELVETAATDLMHGNSIDEIVALLTEHGVAPETAARLVLLIPSAFAREYFEPQGISFPENFLSGPQGHFVLQPYSGEPIYVEARALARRWISESKTSLVERVLDWSAEADLIKQAKQQGTKPERISEIHHGF
jgi:hypothetical protein